MFKGSKTRWELSKVVEEEEEEIKEEDAPPSSPRPFEEAWGFAFTVVGRRVPAGMRLNRLMGNLKEQEAVALFPNNWTVECDIAIGKLDDESHAVHGLMMIYEWIDD